MKDLCRALGAIGLIFVLWNIYPAATGSIRAMVFLVIGVGALALMYRLMKGSRRQERANEGAA